MPAAATWVRAAVGPDGRPTDGELLRRFADAHDGGAFELLVWRHAGMVTAAARAVVRDHHHAEDVAQAAFLLLARKAAAVRENPAGWLYRVARRMAVKQRRQVCPAVPDTVAADVRHSRTYEDHAAVHEELAALPDKHRLPVLLCFVEGLSHAEAAARLGWPVGTVAGRIARAKDTLRDRLTRRGLAPGLLPLAAPGGGPFVADTTRAAVAYAAGDPAAVAPTVLSLVTDASRTMFLTKLLYPMLFAVVLGGLTAGGVHLLAPAPAAWANPGGPEDPKRTAGRTQREASLKALKKLALAWHHLQGKDGAFPADICGPDGKPLLSWRVALLPELGAEALYQEFKRDQPWDSPANKPLLAKMPAVYRTAFQPADATDTYLKAFAGPGAVLEPGKKLAIKDIPRGAWDTSLLFAEAGPAVPWTKPADIADVAAVRWPFADVANVARLDGVCQAIDPSVPDDRLAKLAKLGAANPDGTNGLTPPRPAGDDAGKAGDLVRVTFNTKSMLEALLKKNEGLTDQAEAERLNTAVRELVEKLRAAKQG